MDKQISDDLLRWDSRGYSNLEAYLVGLNDESLKVRDKKIYQLLEVGLKDLYQDFGEEILKGIKKLVSLIDNLKREGKSVAKQENTLVVYPGTFGGFKQLAELLPKWKETGITQVHVLPLYEQSGDDGFAVKVFDDKKPLKIAKEWGGEEEFSRLSKKAKELGMSLMVDVVLNHIAVDSPILWNQSMVDRYLLAFEKGNEPFKFIKLRTDENGGQYAVYKVSGGEEEALVIFPEQADINHPQTIELFERTVWHTFYPFQADLDLNKPEAFELVCKKVMQVAEWLGRSGTIRLDAIPYVGKRMDKTMFEYQDSDRGYQIICLLRLVLTLVAPKMKMLAEAARPLNEMMAYPERVGAGYDFLSLPLLLQAIMEEKPELFVDKIKEMTEVVGFEGMSRLAMILQTHDDYPLAELKDGKVIRKVWQSLEGRGAETFGIRKEEVEAVPKGAVIRLMEVCDKNPEKLMAAVALASFLPHGKLLYLYGTETGELKDDECYKLECERAKRENRQPDKRAYIRQTMDKGEYLKKLDSDLSLRFAKLQKQRLELMPDKLTSFKAECENGVVEIRVEGIRGVEAKRLKVIINLTGEEREEFGVSLMSYAVIIQA